MLPDDLWELWLKIILDTLNTLCPWRRIAIRENQPEWFDTEVRNAIRKKTELYKRIQNTNISSDWEELRVAKRKVRNLIIKKKRTYICGKLNDYKDVPCKFWKAINNNLYMGNIKSKTQNIRIYNSNKVLVDGSDAATEINNFYSNVGRDLASVFTSTWKPKNLIQQPYYRNMQFRFIGEKETISLVKTLPLNKSSNVQGIAMKYLKDALLITSFEICHILNESISQSIIPLYYI